MENLTPEHITKRLIEIAEEEGRNVKTISSLKALRDELGLTIEQMESPAKTMRKSLKDYLLHIQEKAGETVVHGLVTYRVRKKWQYDRKLALDWADEHMPSVVNKSLRVRPFEKLLPLPVQYGEGEDKDIITDYGFPSKQIEVSEISLPSDLSHLLFQVQPSETPEGQGDAE